MNLLQNIYYLLSPYVDVRERRIDLFFKSIGNNKSNKHLIDLLQKDIVVLNLWTESRYKGYNYLNKKTRDNLYKNADAIKDDFSAYISKENQNISNLTDQLKILGINYNNIIDKDKFEYLCLIMSYLSPLNGRFQYRESSTFGELLKNPNYTTLKGDCNQIVTLYIYLYSLRYPITDLHLTTFPGHVALHYKGVDLEATQAIFTLYTNKDRKILPIQEIVSINLLDTTDTSFETGKVSPEHLLESAKLAFLISSERDIVKHNINVAYSNAVSKMISNNNFKVAIQYAQNSQNKQLINLTSRNGAAYYLSIANYSMAIKLATHADNSNELINNIYYNQGAALYNREKYHDAIRVFKRNSDTNLIQKCYTALYFKERSKLGRINSEKDIKQNSTVIHNMYNYSKKTGNKDIINESRKIYKYL